MLNDLDKFMKFDTKNNQIIYNNKQNMIIQIPGYFKDRKYFDTDPDTGNVRFLGIALVTIGNQKCSLVIPAMLETIPSEISEENEIISMTYQQDDIFLAKDFIILSNVSANDIFTSFGVLGKELFFLNYEDLVCIYDNLQIITGKTLGQRADFELLVAETCRDKKNLNKLFRHTNIQKNDFKQISLRNIAYGPKSVTSKTVGSYFNDGMIGSLVVEDDGNPTSKIEALLKS